MPVAERTDLVIFDCDGVLVDSEPISIGLLVEMVRSLGGVIDEETAFRSFLGRSMQSIAGTLQADHGIVLGDAHLAAFRAELFRRFAERLKPVAGVADAIAGLDTRSCVASSSSLERIRHSLDLTGLLALLEPNIYSASMVERGKPAPDLFLHAARSMGARPGHCIVIEDSPAGILAARSAGMRVLAFVGGSHAAPAGLRPVVEALKPDAVFDDMHRLPELLGRIAAAPGHS